MPFNSNMPQLGHKGNDQNVLGSPVRQSHGIRQWETLVSSSLYDMEMTSIQKREEFSGTIQTKRVGEVTFAVIDASPHLLERTTKTLDARAEDKFGISLQLSGNSSITQHGKTNELKTGDYCFYDPLHPYIRTFEEPYKSLAVLFPKRNLLLPDHTLYEAMATVVRADNELVLAISTFLGSISNKLDNFSNISGHRLANAVLELLATPLLREIDGGELEKNSEQESLKVSILDYIHANLDDSELSAKSIAQHFHISLRYLFQLFSSEDHSLIQLIRSERLALAKSKLQDPSLSWLSIARISEDSGYPNANYFSRTFKEEFGVTPTEFRDLAFSMSNESEVEVVQFQGPLQNQ